LLSIFQRQTAKMSTIIFGGGGGRPLALTPNPPYPPTDWPLGGLPSIRIDVAVMAVFLFLFLIGLVLHLALLAASVLRRGGFVLHSLMSLFCAIGITALGIRMASTVAGTNGYLYVGSVELVAILTILLVLINLAYAHRIIRGQHPVLGILSYAAFAVLYLLILFAAAVLLAGVGQPYFTLDSLTRYNDRAFRIFGWTFFAIVALLPIPMIAISSCLPSRRRDAGSWYLQAWLLTLGTILVALQVWYIAGVEWARVTINTTRFLPIPGWLQRGWYYIMIWTIDVIIIFLYAAARGPSRFGRRGTGGGAIAAGAPGRFGRGNRYDPGGPVAAGAAGPSARPRRRFGLGALALGAGAGGAAGAMLGRRRQKQHRSEKEAEMEAAERGDLDDRAISPGPRLDTPRDVSPLSAHDMEPAANKRGPRVRY